MSLRLGACSIAALAALSLAGCGGGDGGSSAVDGAPISFEALTSSASTSADAASARFVFDMSMSFPGADEPFAFTGEGAFDTTSGRATLAIDMSSFAGLLGGLFSGVGGQGGLDLGNPDDWKIEVVQDGLVMYMRFPALAEKMPSGTSWVKMDLRKMGSAQGLDLEQLQQFTNSGPRVMLDYLQAVAGKIETVGKEELRGVDTTHYHATVDLLQYGKLAPPAQREQLGSLLGDLVKQSGLRELPMDVWIDELGLVRKLTMSYTATQPGMSGSASMSMTFELFDYGTDVAIELPPASETVDASSLRS